MRKRTGVFLMVAVLSGLGLKAAMGRSSEAVSAGSATLTAESSNVAEREASRAEAPQELQDRERSKIDESASPTAMSVGGMRLLAGPRATEGKPVINIPELDDILERDEENEARTSQVTAHLKEKLPAGAEVRDVNVRCVDSFCRVVLVKPDVGTPWHEINQLAFEDWVTGEMMFSTRSDGPLSTGFVYFAEGTNTLPIGATPGENDPDDV